jgi:hypothetical protein
MADERLLCRNPTTFATHATSPLLKTVQAESRSSKVQRTVSIAASVCNLAATPTCERTINDKVFVRPPRIVNGPSWSQVRATTPKTIQAHALAASIVYGGITFGRIFLIGGGGEMASSEWRTTVPFLACASTYARSHRGPRGWQKDAVEFPVDPPFTCKCKGSQNSGWRWPSAVCVQRTTQ